MFTSLLLILIELNCKLPFHYLAENKLLSFIPRMICQSNVISYLKQTLLTFIWEAYSTPCYNS